VLRSESLDGVSFSPSISANHKEELQADRVTSFSKFISSLHDRQIFIPFTEKIIQYSSLIKFAFYWEEKPVFQAI